MNTPLLSVWMFTYNHEKFIAKALDSVLMQETNFEFEIVIGEDCSTDNTRAIVQEYEAKYPHIIKPIYHEQNVGGSRNAYEFTLPKCKGKYIACLEGDDYWTTPDKLQKQVDFLEEQPGYTATGHQCTITFEDGSASKRFGAEENESYTFTDFLNHRKFHTSSLVFRSETMEKNQPIPTTILSMDRAIYLALSLHGKIKYLADDMGVYRKNSGGITTRVTYKHLETDLNMLPWLKRISSNFPANQCKSFIHFCIYNYGKKEMPIFPLVKHFVLFVFYSFSYFPKNLGDVKWGLRFFWKKLKYNL